MSSENDMTAGIVSMEELMRSRLGSLLLMIGGMAISENHDQQTMMIIGSSDVDSILSQISNKDGSFPATKASIEALPAVKITEEHTKEECSICLTEYEFGGEAKQMPCEHRFHSGCIDKWLGIHGSCPVCRYKMPEEEKKERAGEILVVIGRFGPSEPGSENGPIVSGSDPDSNQGSQQ